MELSDDRKKEITDFLRSKFSIETDDIEIYNEAFTHGSHGYPNNQRLASLGDRVLSFIIAEHLYHEHPDFEIGRLDQERQKVDANSNFARIAREIGLEKPMVFGGSYQDADLEEIRNKEKEMAEVFEALLGAIYIDQGLDSAREIAIGLLF